MQLLARWLGVFCLAALSLSAQARDWDAIKKDGTIIVATEGAFYPFNYFEGPKLTGFEVDLAEAVVKQMGLKLDWRVVPFDAQLAAIRQGRFDFAIASHGYTSERAKAVDYGNYHYCTGGQIAAWKGGPLTAAALAGKSVAVQLSTSYAENAKKIPGIGEIKTFSRDTEAFQALKAHKVDAWISDRFLQKATLEKNGDPNLVTGDLVFTEKVGAIFQKGNEELKSHYNSALAAVMKSGEYKKLSEKYFREDISCR